MPHVSNIVESLRSLLTYGVERHDSADGVTSAGVPALGRINDLPSQNDCLGSAASGVSEQSSSVRGRYTPPHLRGVPTRPLPVVERIGTSSNAYGKDSEIAVDDGSIVQAKAPDRQANGLQLHLSILDFIYIVNLCKFRF